MKEQSVLEIISESKIRIKKKPSFKLLYNALIKNNKLNTLVICEGMKKYINKYETALKEVGVNIEFIKCKRGRKVNDKFKLFKKMAFKYPVKEISKKLNVPLRTAYYWVSLLKKNRS